MSTLRYLTRVLLRPWSGGGAGCNAEHQSPEMTSIRGYRCEGEERFWSVPAMLMCPGQSCSRDAVADQAASGLALDAINFQTRCRACPALGA